MAGYFGQLLNAPYFGGFYGVVGEVSPEAPLAPATEGSLILREAIADLWDLTGELSDLDPWGASTGIDPDPATDLDPNSYGVRYFLRRLSDAQGKLANWKTNRRRPLRFSTLNDVTNIQIGLDTQNYQAQLTADPRTLRVLIPTYGMTAESFDESRIDLAITTVNTETGVLSTTTNTYMTVFADVVDAVWVDLTFREDIDIPEGSLVSMSASYYFRKFRIRDRVSAKPDGYNLHFPRGLKTILKLTDLDDSTTLSKSYRKDDLVDSGLSLGKPTEWYTMGNYLYFDSYIEEPFWLRFEYIRYPDTLTSLDSSFDIPEDWVDILVMIATFHIEQSRQENQKSQVTKNDIDYWISRRRAEIEDEFLRDELGAFYVEKE